MIVVEGVEKHYGSVVAVAGLSFEVHRGEVVGLLGPNGAGKTTTMRMLTGTLQPDKGTVRFDGASILEGLSEAKRRIGYLPESNPLYDEMLVVEYLDYVARLRGLSAEATRSSLARAVEQTGVAEVFYRPIGELSKGYRQRVGLAAAILHQPEILVLDEPTEGLDPNQRVDIRRLINELGKERTILLSTHVMQEVEATCSRLLILSKGRLVAEGSVQDLLSQRSGVTRYVTEIEGDGVVSLLAGLPGVRSHRSERVDGRTRVHLEVSGEEELRPRIYEAARDRGWTLWELHREKVSLEQIFRDLTSEDHRSGESGLDAEDVSGPAAGETGRGEEAGK